MVKHRLKQVAGWLHTWRVGWRFTYLNSIMRMNRIWRQNFKDETDSFPGRQKPRQHTSYCGGICRAVPEKMQFES